MYWHTQTHTPFQPSSGYPLTPFTASSCGVEREVQGFIFFPPSFYIPKFCLFHI